jgi:hypothetical protein
MFGCSFLSPAVLILRFAGPEETKNQRGGGTVLRLIQIRLAMLSFEKISLACQDNSAQPRIAASTSANAVSFSFSANDETLSVAAR